MKNKTSFLLLPLIFLWAGPGPARALEVSLEENRADRGNIGYVDLKKVFRIFPETKKMKQSYAEIVRQAEEKVNLKKAELITLRSQIALLKAEMKLAQDALEPPLPEPITPPASRAAPVSESTSTAAPVLLAPEGLDIPEDLKDAPAPALLDLKGLPGMESSSVEEKPDLEAPAAKDSGDGSAESEPSADPGRAPAAPVLIDIPGLADEPAAAAPTEGEAVPGVAEDDGAAAAWKAAAREAAARESAERAREYEEQMALWAAAVRDRDERIKKLGMDIAVKELTLAKLEKDFVEYQAEVEKNLIDIENRRSEILLGKIYRAIREIARENGISVVVDKSQILFGQGSVNLTDKVLKKLGEAL